MGKVVQVGRAEAGPLLDLKFLLERAAKIGGTSNPPHQAIL